MTITLDEVYDFTSFVMSDVYKQINYVAKSLYSLELLTSMIDFIKYLGGKDPIPTDREPEYYEKD